MYRYMITKMSVRCDCYGMIEYSVMKRAVIFDMDGVMVSSEALWNRHEENLFPKILAPKIAEKALKSSRRGLSEAQIFQMLHTLGHTGHRQELYDAYDTIARDLYREAPMMPGLDGVIERLHQYGARLGLDSASPIHWIHLVLDRLPHAKYFSYVESVNEHPELRPKPAPDGYLAAMGALGVLPEQTVIIEDSVSGLTAAAGAGAHVCCFTFYMEKEPEHDPAYQYARTSKDLLRYCKRFIEESAG